MSQHDDYFSEEDASDRLCQLNSGEIDLELNKSIEAASDYLQDEDSGGFDNNNRKHVDDGMLNVNQLAANAAYETCVSLLRYNAFNSNYSDELSIELARLQIRFSECEYQLNLGSQPKLNVLTDLDYWIRQKDRVDDDIMNFVKTHLVSNARYDDEE